MDRMRAPERAEMARELRSLKKANRVLGQREQKSNMYTGPRSCGRLTRKC